MILDLFVFSFFHMKCTYFDQVPVAIPTQSDQIWAAQAALDQQVQEVEEPETSLEDCDDLELRQRLEWHEMHMQAIQEWGP